MGLIDKIKRYFVKKEELKPVDPELKLEISSFKLEHSIYCQNCGRDITIEGGDVSSNKRIYCHGYKDDGKSRCLDREMTDMINGKIPLDPIFFNYHDANEVQEAIKKCKLAKYSLLEEIR